MPSATSTPRKSEIAGENGFSPFSCAADHLQVRRLVYQAGVEMRSAADDDRVVVGDARGQIAVRVDIHVEALAKEVDPGLGDPLPDEDLHTDTGSANASCAAVTAALRSTSAPASTIASSSAVSAVVTSKTSM